MVNGLFGPRPSSDARAPAVDTPQSAAPAGAASPSDIPSLVPGNAAETWPSAAPDMDALYELGDGLQALITTDGDGLERWEMERSAHGPDMRTGLLYRQLFSDIPLEDAVLTLFCRAATVTNVLFGDNEYSNPIMTQTRRRWPLRTRPTGWDG